MRVGADRAQQRRAVGRSCELGQENDVDGVRGQLRDRAGGAGCLVDGVPVGVQLGGEECALRVVGAGDEKGMLHVGLRCVGGPGACRDHPAPGR